MESGRKISFIENMQGVSAGTARLYIFWCDFLLLKKSVLQSGHFLTAYWVKMGKKDVELMYFNTLLTQKLVNPALYSLSEASIVPSLHHQSGITKTKTNWG